MKKVILLLLSVMMLCGSCTPKLFKGMDGDGKQPIAKKDLYLFYPEKGKSTLYTMELNIRNNVVNCLLMVEPKDSSDDMRLVCTSVFGTTILDANLTRKGMLIYNCADEIRHKKFLKLLEKDFRTIFFQNLRRKDVYNGKVYSQAEKSEGHHNKIVTHKGYTISPKKTKYNYKTDEVGKKLTDIETDGKLTKSNVHFDYKDGETSPYKIAIEHPVLKLSIVLELAE